MLSFFVYLVHYILGQFLNVPNPGLMLDRSYSGSNSRSNSCSTLRVHFWTKFWELIFGVHLLDHGSTFWSNSVPNLQMFVLIFGLFIFLSLVLTLGQIIGREKIFNCPTTQKPEQPLSRTVFSVVLMMTRKLFARRYSPLSKFPTINWAWLSEGNRRRIWCWHSSATFVA